MKGRRKKSQSAKQISAGAEQKRRGGSPGIVQQMLLGMSSRAECFLGGQCAPFPPPPVTKFIHGRTDTAEDLFNTSLAALLGSVGLYKACQRTRSRRAASASAAAGKKKRISTTLPTESSASSSPERQKGDDFFGEAKAKAAEDAAEQKSNKPRKPASIKSLQLRFLPVFWLFRLAFWMAGPYFYPVYASKIFNGMPASDKLISRIFLVGFAAIVIFAPLTGKALDQYGRKRGTIAAALLYALGALSTKFHGLLLLLAGRAVGGIGTNLLSGAPESWLVSEAMNTGDDNDGTYLKETFGLAYAFDPVVAIVAGQIAGWCAAYGGPTGPFTIMPVFLIVGGLITALFWKENKGGIAGEDSSGKGSGDKPSMLPLRKTMARVAEKRRAEKHRAEAEAEKRRTAAERHSSGSNISRHLSAQELRRKPDPSDFDWDMEKKDDYVKPIAAVHRDRSKSDFAVPPNHAGKAIDSVDKASRRQWQRVDEDGAVDRKVSQDATDDTAAATDGGEKDAPSIMSEEEGGDYIVGLKDHNGPASYNVDAAADSTDAQLDRDASVPMRIQSHPSIKELGVKALKDVDDSGPMDRTESQSTLGFLGARNLADREKRRAEKIRDFRNRKNSLRSMNKSQSGLELVKMPSLNNLNIEDMDDTPTVRDGFLIIATDQKLFMLGAVQSLFEGSMYVFVMQWPPALIMAVKGYYGRNESVPFGTVFSCFMACCMVGSTIFGKLSSRKGASMERIFLGMLIASTASMAAATWAIYTGHDFATLVFSFFAFEGCVGMYFPLIGFMRGKYLHASHRSVIMTLFCVPLNVLVVTVCLFIGRLGTIGAFEVTTVALAVASICMARLIAVRKKEARRHWRETKRALRSLSLVKNLSEAVRTEADLPEILVEIRNTAIQSVKQSIKDSIVVGHQVA